MSDYQDEQMGDIARMLGQSYAALATVCLNLPVPVTLPTGAVNSEDAAPAVRRVVEIVKEMPMPERTQADLFSACVYWLGALDIYSIMASDYHSVRGYSAVANILAAESALQDLAEWLHDQQHPGEQQ
ncbi:hypothetical protein [Streptomyces sp. NPDC052496]|uniref:hypothetical protein n=1 Tax=Streptomyces sp. NPDC052496 TaxID=3154951 RepID=UPI00344103B5